MHWPQVTLLDYKKWVWLNVESITKVAAAKLAHRIIHTQQPSLLTQRITNTTVSTRHTRMTGDNKLGARPRNVGRTTTTSQHFRASIYKIYEEIPEIIKEIKKPKIFKQRLKRYYLNNDDLPYNRTYNQIEPE